MSLHYGFWKPAHLVWKGFDVAGTLIHAPSPTPDLSLSTDAESLVSCSIRSVWGALKDTRSSHQLLRVSYYPLLRALRDCTLYILEASTTLMAKSDWAEQNPELFFTQKNDTLFCISGMNKWNFNKQDEDCFISTEMRFCLLWPVPLPSITAGNHPEYCFGKEANAVKPRISSNHFSLASLYNTGSQRFYTAFFPYPAFWLDKRPSTLTTFLPIIKSSIIYLTEWKINHAMMWLCNFFHQIFKETSKKYPESKICI